MPKNHHHIASSNYWSVRSQREAFTLIELLVVIAIIAILAALLLPALASAKQRALMAADGSNLQQYGLACQMYANDHHQKLPAMGTTAGTPDFGGYWPWDMSVTTANALTREGAERHILYSPAFKQQDNDTAWGGTNGFYNGYRVTGYANTFAGGSQDHGLVVTNVNTSMLPTTITWGPYHWPPPSPSKRVLLATAVISDGNVDSLKMTYDYTQIHSGVSGLPFHRSPFTHGKLALGGNVCMMDGHVQWRKLEVMHPRTITSNGGSPVPGFWW